MMAHSTAEKYRQHRAAMELSLELGCTPREAADELSRRAAWAHLSETRARLQAKTAPLPAARMAADQEPAPELWWKRD